MFGSRASPPGAAGTSTGALGVMNVWGSSNIGMASDSTSTFEINHSVLETTQGASVGGVAGSAASVRLANGSDWVVGYVPFGAATATPISNRMRPSLI